MQPKRMEVTVSNRTVIRVLVLGALAFLVIKLLGHVMHPLQLILISAFLSLALNPAVKWISKHLRIKTRGMATGLAYLVVVVLLGLFINTVVPPLVHQTVDFVRSAPTTINDLNTNNSALSSFVRRYHLQNEVKGFSENIKQRTKNLQQPVVSTAGRLGSALISILTVFVLTFMMLVEGPEWVTRALSFQPQAKREHYKSLLRRMYRIVTGYVNGQLLLALIGAGFDFLVLVVASHILHVSVNAVALAGIVALTGLIPMIGHTIGASIVVLACLFVSTPLAVIMAIVVIVYQQVENITLQPYIQAKYNELTPLLVFVSALLGIGVAGLLGAFVAIPAAGCARILFLDYHERKNAKQLA